MIRNHRGDLLFLCVDIDCDSGLEFHGEEVGKDGELVYQHFIKNCDFGFLIGDEVMAAISAKEAQNERLANFIKVLKAQDGTISEFDGSLWGSMVEFVTVGRDKDITVTFRDGTEIQA